MRKLALLATILMSLGSVGVASAAPSHHQTSNKTTTAVVSTKPVYCGNTAWDKQYAAIYAYPTGSYWQSQIAAYPDYYAANNAYYLATYGC